VTRRIDRSAIERRRHGHVQKFARLQRQIGDFNVISCRRGICAFAGALGLAR
jgi:hypothetical protein